MDCAKMVQVMDKLKGRIFVPCGQCLICLEKRKKEWAFRLKRERRDWRATYFITLTYADQYLTYQDALPTLVKKDVQLFLKRFRKNMNVKCKYFLVGEYGTENHRPHYHMILFINEPMDKVNFQMLKDWGKGIIDFQPAETGSLYYVAGYMLNKKENSEIRQPEFLLCSKNLGLNYAKLEDYHKTTKNNYVVVDGGIKQSLPRYYKKRFDQETVIRARSRSRMQIEQKFKLKSIEELKEDARLYNDRHQSYEILLSKNKKNREKL